jgi:Transposase
MIQAIVPELIHNPQHLPALSSKRFGFVQTLDTKPKRRLYEVLHSQGLQMNQEITFLADGNDTLRALQLEMSPQATHILDWFHVVRQEVA